MCRVHSFIHNKTPPINENNLVIILVAMLLFCSNCHNTLTIEEGSQGYRFACSTCPFAYNIKHVMSSRVYPKLKEIDDILGGPSAWEHAQITDATCPKCNNSRAYFFQLQTRSADEPMTTFYRCENKDCTHNWKEN